MLATAARLGGAAATHSLHTGRLMPARPVARTAAAHGVTRARGGARLASPRVLGGKGESAQVDAAWCSQPHRTLLPPRRLGEAATWTGVEARQQPRSTAACVSALTR
jgi:hypothetical protein